MKTDFKTIRAFMNALNNEDEDGGYWLPNIQRNFVWKEEGVSKLFDSILRQYPISTLLVWKTQLDIRHRRFINEYKKDGDLTEFINSENNKKKYLVLDGQQRLQSLFIGLKGSHCGRELFMNILSGDESFEKNTNVEEELKYQFKFFVSKDLKNDSSGTYWVKFKDIVFNDFGTYEMERKIKNEITFNLTEKQEIQLGKNVSNIFKSFRDDSNLVYQVLDGVEKSEIYTEDDVVEVFIRANDGGTQLSKSDLLFALLSSNWRVANEKVEELLLDLNGNDIFNFKRDFILKTCLVLMEKGAKYEVKKFRNSTIKEDVENNWEKIAISIKDVIDFLTNNTFIKNHKSLPSDLALIPLIFICYKYPKIWNEFKQYGSAEKYLLRVLLSGVFSGHADQLLDGFIKVISESVAKENKIDVSKIFKVVADQNKTLKIYEEKFWNIGYKSKLIYILFNIWYLGNLSNPKNYKNNLEIR
jgi:uncharacterized protein with ParB-like and HNH nuclease domain